MNENIYTDGTYLMKNPSWHLEDSKVKAQWITNIIPANLRAHIGSVGEIGCGYGSILNELQSSFSKNCQFIGIDISATAINYAMEKFPGIKFIIGDIYTLDQEKYDLLLVIDLLEHVYYQHNFLDTVKTKSNYSIFHIPIGSNFKNNLFDRYKKQMEKYGHIQFYSLSQIINLLTNSGLAIKDYFYTFGLEHKNNVIYYPLKWMFHLSPYLISQFIGLVSVMVLCESLKNPHDEQ